MFISKDRLIQLQNDIKFLKDDYKRLKGDYWRLYGYISIICDKLGIEIIDVPAKTIWKVKEKK